MGDFFSSGHNGSSQNADRAHDDWRQVEGFNALFEYWQSCRKDKALPLAEKFDLLALTQWLPDIWLIDVKSRTDMSARFAGTAIVERMGTDITRKNVFSLQSEETRQRTQAIYLAIVNHPCGAISRYSNHYSTGRSGIIRALFLPMTNASGKNERIVCMSIREEDAEYAAPVEQTISATDISQLEWIDIGFSVPAFKG